MASAKECDLCGTLYKDKSIIPSYIMERKDLIVHYYDLCPDCYKSFREWLDKHKQKEDTE